MLRLALIAVLITSQGLPSVARGMMLCLHADGGFCLEAGDEACCDERHEHDATALGCCGESPGDTALRGTNDGPPCDCTHLALVDDPRAAGKLARAEIDAGDLSLRIAAINLTALAGAVARGDLPRETLSSRASGPSAALLFLAPVMLRC